MNEPMHLVPRHDILTVMQLLETTGLVEDNDCTRELHARLNKITDKPPSNVAVSIA